MSDTRKKKRISFNVFDVFIILLIVVLIGTVVYKVMYSSSDNIIKDKSKYMLVFECEEEYNSLSKYIKDGDEVYIKSNGKLIGYIRDDNIISATAIDEVVDDTEKDTSASGAVGDEEYDELYRNVKFTGKIKLNGNTQKSRDGSYYLLDDFNITVGSKIEVYTDNAQFTVIVKEISNINK